LAQHEVIAVFQEALSDIQLPACITLSDEEGLILYSIGDCGDDIVIESVNAQLIMAYESLRTSLVDSKRELDYLLTSSSECSYFIDNLNSGKHFMIVRTKEEIMMKILPFLRSVTDSIQKMMSTAEEM
jgi:hypothetical protein